MLRCSEVKLLFQNIEYTVKVESVSSLPLAKAIDCIGVHHCPTMSGDESSQQESPSATDKVRVRIETQQQP